MLNSSKKIFALATTATLVGALAFGCSSTNSDSNGTDDASGDSGIKCKRGQTVKKGKCVTAPSTDDTASTDDTGTTKDSGVTTKDSGTTTTTTDGGGSCYDASKISAFVPETLPTSHAYQATKCSAGEITTLATACGADFAAGTDAACFTALKAAPATCRACVYSECGEGGTPANVGPFFSDTTGNNINIAGCLDITSASVGCGGKYVNYNSCLDASECGDVCEDQDTFDACLASAKTACKAKVSIDDACITAGDGAAGDKCYVLAPAGGGNPGATEYGAWVNSLATVFCK